MPATSEKQRRAAFAALNVKRGKGKGKGAAKQMAQMPEASLRHFTKLKKGSKK